MTTLSETAAKHVDNAPFWAGEGIGLVFLGIFVIFALYVVVQRVRAGRKQKETQR